MAANIPAQIRQAGMTPFVLRANQLETAKPVISYWCLFWAVNQIIAKGLHNSDQECREFTTMLMDRLEQTKTSQAGNDAITDDVAGQAYVEQFAQETFDRALRTLKANKVTQQTASTFEAAATFFQLTSIWTQPDAETQEKIKYSKWNAARILKAIKAGEDPNESNPKEPEPEPEAAVLDPNDPEVQAIGGVAPPMAAYVEDTVDEENKHLRPPSPPSPAPVSEPTSPPASAAPAPEQVSPIGPPGPSASDPDGYFPSAPPPAPADEEEAPFTLPSAPTMPAGGIPSPSTHQPSAPPVSHTGLTSPNVAPPSLTPDLSRAPQQYYQATPTPPAQPQYQGTVSSMPFTPPAPQRPIVPTVVPQQPPPLAQMYGQSNSPPPPFAPAPTIAVSEVAMAQAQKHAKWAISALNFEDVPTAIKELRAALETLGAQ